MNRLLPLATCLTCLTLLGTCRADVYRTRVVDWDSSSLQINCGLFVGQLVDTLPLPSSWECGGHFQFVLFGSRLYVWNDVAKKYEFDSYLNEGLDTQLNELIASRVAGHRLGIREFRYGVH